MGSRQSVVEGATFHFWTVIAVETAEKALCRCVCGRELSRFKDSLISGKSKSCGCRKSALVSARLTKHGHSRKGGTREFRAWTKMKRRCLNENHSAHEYYGNRGIEVCERWKRSFEAFLEDMGPCPDGHTLDRKDNEGHYEPGNCRWATKSEQRRNRRFLGRKRRI